MTGQSGAPSDRGPLTVPTNVRSPYEGVGGLPPDDRITDEKIERICAIYEGVSDWEQGLVPFQSDKRGRMRMALEAVFQPTSRGQSNG